MVRRGEEEEEEEGLWRRRRRVTASGTSTMPICGMLKHSRAGTCIRLV
jgi:hypothetical protein